MNLNSYPAGAEPARNRPQAAGLCGPAQNTNNPALSELRVRLLQEALTSPADPELSNLVRLAATEAEAQAWLTSFPLLVFPALFEEKTQRVRGYIARQRRLRPEQAASAGAPGLNVRAEPVEVR